MDARTARLTGLCYLGNAITGVLGVVLVRPMLFAAGDGAATLANLGSHAALARAGVALELGMVLTQTLAAVCFARLFRSVDPFAAIGIAAFGLVSATVGLMSAALLATAVEVSTDPFGPAAANVQVLHLVGRNLWGVGAVFFGLWLVPMGWCALRARMPRALGWLLVGGGAGYVVGAFLRYLLPDAGAVAEALSYPASAGELWMVGYLLLRGVPRPAPPADVQPDPSGITMTAH